MIIVSSLTHAACCLLLSCFPNTLDTTILKFEIGSDGKPDTFVITGDIPAMWLRDSTCQVWPYLPYVTKDDRLKTMIKGVIFRQLKSVLIDPYANAFQYDASKPSPWQHDDRIPPMQPAIWEGKYELDSLIYVLRLANEYYVQSGDASIFQDKLWQQATQKIFETLKIQQRSTEEDKPPSYYFRRPGEVTTPKPNARTGLAKSYFRASDDPATYLFNIAENAMACVELAKCAEVWRKILKREDIASIADSLVADITQGLLDAGVVTSKKGDLIFAYEVDGLGNSTIMDDANVPSLLSLPYLGYIRSTNALYNRTRNVLLSPENPYYFNGTQARGIGSPHTLKLFIWPIALIQQALTSNDDKEIMDCLEMLKRSGVGSNTYFMHESFFMNDVNRFT